MGIIRHTFKQGGCYRFGAALLSVGLLSSPVAYAQNKHENTKDPSLVAFYNEVFGKEPVKQKAPSKVKHKPAKSRVIQLDDGCKSFPAGSENEFALDLKRKKQQQNLKSLLSDDKLIKQTDYIKNETSKIEHIDSEIFLDLVQSGTESAYISLGKRIVRCKKPHSKAKTSVQKAPKKSKTKPVTKAIKPKKLVKPVEVIKPVTKQPSKVEAVKAVEEKLTVEEPIVVESIVKQKQTKVHIHSKCSATPTNKPTANANINDLFAKAFGKKSAVATPSKISSQLRIDNIVLGDIELFSNSSGSIDEADTKVLLELLKEVLKERFYSEIKQKLEKSDKTRFCTLNELGINTVYNTTNLSLDIQVDLDLRKPQILSLLNKKSASVREENKIKAEKVSAYVNAYTSVGLNNNDEADFGLRLEGSLNLNGFVFETSGDYQNEIFDLGRSSVTYDIPEKLQRFALGNISTGNRNFQENLELDGIRISKEFFLDPDLQISPRANEPLQLDTDSEVELYINNQLIRRFYLNAGVYSLEDIGLYNGANDIRIRIKDKFGKITVKSSKQYYDSHLLKPGLSLYAASVGYLSNQGSFSNDDLVKSPIFSGYYQKGLTEEFTFSLDAQISSESFLLGAETISSLPIGSLINGFAISKNNENETGYAASFEFKPNIKYEKISLDTLNPDFLKLDTRPRSFINNWSLTGEFRSEAFSMLSDIEIDSSVDDVTFGELVISDNKLKGNLQANFNLNINEKWQGNLNLGVADYYDADESYYANLTATKRFENNTRLSIGARYDTEDEFSMNLQLSIPLSRKKGKRKVDLDVLADSHDNSYETRLSVKPTSLVGKNSLAGSLEHYSDKENKQQQLDFQYRNSLFESNLTARNSKSNNDSSSRQDLDFNFNTAIACVGGHCSTSYPINDSFALVSGPSNQAQPIALSNNNIRFKYSDGNDTGLPDNYTALIPNKNKKAVVRLESYRSQNINIDEGTLPNGYDSEKTEFAMFPKYHQGFLIKAGGEPATSIEGMLFDNENKTLGFKGGQWIPLKEGKTIAFFSNKGGMFRVTSIPAGKYKLELFDYPDMEPIQITVPDTKGKTHNIGKLIIKTPN